MSTLIKFLAGCGLVAAWGWYLKWSDGFHLVAGGILLAFGITIVVFRRMRASGEEAEDSTMEVEDNFLRSTAIGLGIGLGLCLAFWAWFSCLERIPAIYEFAYDTDRKSLENQLSTLERAGNHDDAVRLIQSRLARKLSSQWENDLGRRLYDNLVRAGKSRTVPDGGPFFEKAVTVAERYGLAKRTFDHLEVRHERPIEVIVAFHGGWKATSRFRIRLSSRWTTSRDSRNEAPDEANCY